MNDIIERKVRLMVLQAREDGLLRRPRRRRKSKKGPFSRAVIWERYLQSRED